MFKYSGAVMAAALIMSIGQVAVAQEAGSPIKDSYICVFKPGMVFSGGAQAAARGAAQSVGGQLRHVYSSSIKGFSASMTQQAVNRLKANNMNIAYCEQDQVVTVAPVQTTASRKRTTTQPAQATPWGITRVGGGVAGTTKRAWVIDTGIDLTHPDLNVDTSRSRSFLGGTTTAADQNGHGTHVAGTIAARNNTIGVIGVSPGAPVVSVRVLDARGSGAWSNVIAGVDYVSANASAGDVANMSLGGGITTALDDAVIAAANKGIFFVIAAGNSSADANTSSPARANGTNIFTISASDSTDKLASFSNYGNPPIDWAAPGVNIQSTWLSGGYNTISGTSMAAPHVAGLLLNGVDRVISGGEISGDRDLTPDKIAVYKP